MRERGSWDVRFQWGFNDWEVELVGGFLHLLEYHSLCNEDGDQVRWRLIMDGGFDIRSFYNALRGPGADTFL